MYNETFCQKTERWWKDSWRKIQGWLPMFRRTHWAELQKAQDTYQSNCLRYRNMREAEVERACEAIDAIVYKAAKTRWDLDFKSGAYQLTLMLDPEFCGQLHYKDELPFVAKRIAYRVQREIETSRFIKSPLYDEYEKAKQEAEYQRLVHEIGNKFA